MRRTRVHTSEQWLPRSRETVFDFFGDAGNLQQVTPDWLSFEILTPTPIHMGRGTRIDYRLKLHGIPIRWQTEITEWNPPHRFVDVQIRGPYRMWIHEHRFEEKNAGTLMVDRVEYLAPGGWLEPLIHRLFVKQDVQRIFEYRGRRFADLLGSPDFSAVQAL